MKKRENEKVDVEKRKREGENLRDSKRQSTNGSGMLRQTD